MNKHVTYMLKLRSSILLILTLQLNNAIANEIPKQWANVFGVSTFDVVNNMNGKIIQSSSVSWPDGRSALILYLKTAKDIYRCVDYKDKDFVDTGFYCSKLVKPKRFNK